jgi:hypothetical protein
MYQYLGKDNKGIEHLHFYGFTPVEEIIGYVSSIRTLYMSSEDGKFLFDFLDLDIEIDIEDLDKIKEFSISNLGTLPALKIAFLTNSPEKTAYAIYYKIDHTLPNIQREIFHSKEKAIQWLTSNN